MSIFQRAGDRAGWPALVLGTCLLAMSVATIPAMAAIVKGTNQSDRLVGTKHRDTLSGVRGSDTLIGKAKGDTLRGGRGGDTLRPGKGDDLLKGGRGRDRLKARDRQADLLDCGKGQDIAIVDELEDGVYDCEEVIEP